MDGKERVGGMRTNTAHHHTPIVTPAKAGAHPLSVPPELMGRGMDSRLRGNDEVGLAERGA
jgi:hypothetical protein